MMPLSDAKAGGKAQSILARMTASDPADMKGTVAMMYPT